MLLKAIFTSQTRVWIGVGKGLGPIFVGYNGGGYLLGEGHEEWPCYFSKTHSSCISYYHTHLVHTGGWAYGTLFHSDSSLTKKIDFRGMC